MKRAAKVLLEFAFLANNAAESARRPLKVRSLSRFHEGPKLTLGNHYDAWRGRHKLHNGVSCMDEMGPCVCVCGCPNSMCVLPAGVLIMQNNAPTSDVGTGRRPTSDVRLAHAYMLLDHSCACRQGTGGTMATSPSPSYLPSKDINQQATLCSSG